MPSSTSSSRGRWRLLRGVVLTVLLVVGADRSLGAVLVTQVGSSGFRVAELYTRRIDADIVVIGNSTAVHAFPGDRLEAATGRSAFNLAYNGLPGEVGGALIEDYLDRNVAPSQLVVEVTMLLTQDGSRSQFAPFTRYSSRLEDVVFDGRPADRVACEALTLFCFNSELTYRVLAHRNGASDQAEGLDVSGEPAPVAQDPVAPGSMHSVPAAVESVRHALDRADALGTRVVLVAAPIHPSSRRPGEVAERARWLASVGDVLGRNVLDLQDLALPSGSFADRLHLNRAGSAALVPAFVALLQGVAGQQLDDPSLELVAGSPVLSITELPPSPPRPPPTEPPSPLSEPPVPPVDPPTPATLPPLPTSPSVPPVPVEPTVPTLPVVTPTIPR